ncbi:MAG: hypothetical protein CME64_11505 [Halobacteriovoraceae bacterium]|nr:hypothetical protein [Halobacteriovoraceae bacterium]|tara:strand:+ start:49854 stop:50450 length:597 start_codon:yes stop_codon:yes gene_type:complete
MNLPFSPAADRNKEHILGCLKELVTDEDKAVLEVGSGTGQHGVYFSSKLPGVRWIFSDLMENHSVIRAYIKNSGPSNLEGPLKYEIGVDKFPVKDIDLVFTANTFHIMSWKQVKTFIKELGKCLVPGNRFLVYGPFNYNGEYTSVSNEEFDTMLKQRDPKSGIRNFEEVKKQLDDKGFRLLKDYEMPANNRLLAFMKI